MRKGSAIVREEVRNLLLPTTPLLMGVNEVSTKVDAPDVRDKGKGRKKRALTRMAVLHCDIIGDIFWEERQENQVSTVTSCSDSVVGLDTGGAGSKV